MQYDGARRFLFQACAAKSEGQIELAHRKLQRAEAIVENLRNTLDMSQGQIAERLESIYLFCARHLSESRFEPGNQKLEQVSTLLGTLREAWAQIEHS
jgi:flagellar protein FliS